VSPFCFVLLQNNFLFIRVAIWLLLSFHTLSFHHAHVTFVFHSFKVNAFHILKFYLFYLL